MGKGAKPLYSYWDGRHLSYVEARKAIYVPLYNYAILRDPAWQILWSKYRRLCDEDKDLFLVDFDAYDHRSLGMTNEDVVDDPNRTMGHSFVLLFMLEDPDFLNRLLGEGMRIRKGEK